MHINEWLATLWAEMGNQKNKNKVRNRIKTKTKRKSTLNGRLGGRPKSELSQHDIALDQANDETSSDPEWEQPTDKSTRVFRNQKSMFFMSIEKLQDILNGTTCRVCNRGVIQVDIASYNIFNANLLLLCDFCKKENFQWSGPQNLNKAVLMACKYTGIKKGQMGNFSRCLNFGYQLQNGKTRSVNVDEKNTYTMNGELDKALDQMKIHDEKTLLEEIKSVEDKSIVNLACDGYYPIRKNSGICVSTVMVSMNGTSKVLCKFTWECFSKKECFLSIF